MPEQLYTQQFPTRARSFSAARVLLCGAPKPGHGRVPVKIPGIALIFANSRAIIRTIKEPRDIAFVFWAVAIGLACGSEFYLAGVLGSALIAVVLVVANLDLYDSVSYLLVVQGGDETLDPAAVEAAVHGQVRASKLRMRSVRAGSQELTYELRLKSGNTAALVAAVRGCAGVESVNLVSYSGESIG